MNPNPQSLSTLKRPEGRAPFAVFLAVAVFASAQADPLVPDQATNKFNVLFIAVDDLRPELGCYDAPIIKSPNMDRLAARGMVFNRAYCQQAFCNPSRSSLLTGRRPDTTKVHDLETEFRTALPDVVTLPQYFKQRGYHSQGLGKIYHNRMDDAASWSVPHWDAQTENPIYGPKGRQATRERMAEARAQGKPSRWQDGVKGPFWDDPDVADDALPDGKTTERAVAILREIKDKPFFLAVGYHKPHLPFVAPKKYWDLYSEDELQLATHPFPGRNVPSCALHDWAAELRGYIGIPEKGAMPEAQARKMIHGYHATISYVDAQIGRLLDELDRLGLRDNTIVFLWGDHGWHLGDHGLWGKETNFEKATRVPMIISVPRQTTAGRKTDALVELVDVYPTLLELCGLPEPDGLEGTSFTPLLENPKRLWKKAAFSQQPREIPGHGGAMGYSLRTARYRFTEWSLPGQDAIARELYDHQTDPLENENLAGNPKLARTVKELSELLRGGWQAALPSPDTKP
jgi:iduronate 2-sulfatase